jgi:hypothetical protein
MVFIVQGEKTSYDYYGILFISDLGQLHDSRIVDFLHSELFNIQHLGGNWFLVECYIDTTPAA